MHFTCVALLLLIEESKETWNLSREVPNNCNVRWPLTMILKTIQNSGQYNCRTTHAHTSHHVIPHPKQR